MAVDKEVERVVEGKDGSRRRKGRFFNATGDGGQQKMNRNARRGRKEEDGEEEKKRGVEGRYKNRQREKERGEKNPGR